MFCSISICNVVDKRKILGEWYLSVPFLCNRKYACWKLVRNSFFVNNIKCRFICLVKFLVRFPQLFNDSCLFICLHNGLSNIAE